MEGALVDVRLCPHGRAVHTILIRSALIGTLAALTGCSTYRATVDGLGKTVDAVGETFKPAPKTEPVPNVDLSRAEWRKLSPKQPDANPLRAAIVAHDDKIGLTRVVLKAPAGFKLPPYWFTIDGTYTVLKGTFVFDTIDADGDPGKLVQTKGAFSRITPHQILNASTKGGEEGQLYITVYGDWAPQFAETAWGPQTTPQLRAGK